MEALVATLVEDSRKHLEQVTGLHEKLYTLQVSFQDLLVTNNRLDMEKAHLERELSGLQLKIKGLEEQVFILEHSKRDDATIGRKIRLHIHSLGIFMNPFRDLGSLHQLQGVLLENWGIRNFKNFNIWIALIRKEFSLRASDHQKGKVAKKMKAFEAWFSEGRFNQSGGSDRIPESYLQLGLFYIVRCCFKLHPEYRDRTCIDTSDTGNKDKLDISVLEGHHAVKQGYHNLITEFELKISAAAGRKSLIMLGQSTERALNTFTVQLRRVFKKSAGVSQTSAQLFHYDGQRDHFDDVKATPAVTLFPSSAKSEEVTGLMLIIWLARAPVGALGYQPWLN